MSAVKYLSKIEGFPGRFNNLIYVASNGSGNCEPVWPILCYFGGDIQNFRQEMLKIGDCHQYVQDYCLESTALNLAAAFPFADILVVQPSVIFGSFSRYENFVQSADRWGTPRFDDQDRTCYDHLNALLTNARRQIFENNHNAATNPIRATLIAFSKGQVVLNQLARSLKYIAEQGELDKTKRLTFPALYFLDGGHNGNSDVWITRPELIDGLIQNGDARQFRIGVTDFQLQKSKWRADEERQFCNILSDRRPTVDFKRIYLSQKDHPQLSPIELHFKILDYLFQQKFDQ